jgi:hypothetical protein
MYSLIPAFYHCFICFQPPQGAGYFHQGNKRNFELKLESNQLELRSIEVGKLNREFDFLSYADENELINKDSLFREIILLTREVVRESEKYGE